jgi:hypothetical protein
MPYTQDNIANPGSPPLLWSDIDTAFRIINQNFLELYATIGGGTVVDFSNLSTNVSPSVTEVYDLGSSTKRWKDLYLGGSSLYLGDAVITATGSSVNLPAGSTIAGSILDNEYFKTIAVAGQPNIVADAGGEDTLTLIAGNAGITLTTNASTDTLTITNSGVTNAVAGAGISVSGSTGSVTISNAGVTGLTAGQGISLNTGTGNVTVTNSGLVGIDPGIGITVSPRDPITGLVTVTNSQPNIPQNVFNTISVPTQSDVVADSTTDTLTIQTSGNGLSITTNSTTDTLTFSNTGVTSLAVGNGLAIDAGTGSINLTLDTTLSRNIVGDVTGSLFADNSTMLVDATGASIVGDIETSRLRTSETKIALGSLAGATTQGSDSVAIGREAGRTTQGGQAVAIGGLAGETSQGNSAIAVGVLAGQTSQGLSAVALGNQAGQTSQGDAAIAIGPLAGETSQGNYAIAIGYLSGQTNQHAGSIVLNGSGALLNTTGSGFYVNPIRSSSNGRPLMYDAATNELFSSSVLEFVGSTISTSDSSAVQFDGPVTFQTTISTDQGLQLNGPDAIIRSNTSVRIVPTNTLESAGAELTLTGLDVMGETYVVADIANPQGTVQIGGGGNTASVTVRKSTGEVYVGDVWRFLSDGGLYSGFLTAPPDSPTAGAFYVADGIIWDPASKVSASPYPVFYDGISYHALY